jgi:thiamine biosynthesis lipoprotein
MGTLVTLKFGGAAADSLAGEARTLIEEIEAQLSRFRPDSDVSRLSRRPGEWLAVGAHTALVLAEAARLREATEGLFDPALPGRGLEVRHAGGENGQARAGHVPGQAAEARLAVEVLNRGREGRAGKGRDGIVGVGGVTGIDLGGIGKGYAAEACLALCRRRGADSALVGVGVSSFAAMGERAGGGPWRIGLRSPGGGPNDALGVLELAGGALATSGVDEQAGHILDPTTGRSADSGILQATVLAATGMEAEAYSTALMVGGVAAAARWPVASVTVTADAVLASPSARFSPSLAGGDA